MLAPQKESIFGCSCRLWLLSWRRARVFAHSCSLLSKYLPISWKQRKEQSHAQCHVTHRIRIFDKISEHVKVAKSVDIAVPELAVTNHTTGRFLRNSRKRPFLEACYKLLLNSFQFKRLRTFCRLATFKPRLKQTREKHIAWVATLTAII